MHRKALAEFTQNALAEITSNSVRLAILDPFYLAGGTAAALQLGHRISIDLDFFSNENFDPESLLNKFVSAGIKVGKTRFDAGTLKFRLEDTEVSFFYYPYKILEDFIGFQDIKLQV